MMQYIDDVEKCIDHIIAQVGDQINLALPLGLGKANPIANALFDRAGKDSAIKLHIVTALTLEVPASTNELGNRFLRPLVERLYSGYPELHYARARRNNNLPENIKVTEFFLSPGSLLNNATAQRNYISCNYTHAIRDLANIGLNVLAQQVAPHPTDSERCSLSCNPDLTLDLIQTLSDQGKQILTVAQINENLPYLKGQAEVRLQQFDLIVGSQQPCNGHDQYDNFPLFPIPQAPVTLTDYAIAAQATSLIKDGGTIQIGIGSMGDSVAHMMALRHYDNNRYREILDSLTSADHLDLRRQLPLQQGIFEKKLYANSEMFVEGLLFLRKQGILDRWVYPDAAIQNLLNTSGIEPTVSPMLIKQLIESEILSVPLTLAQFTLLQKLACISSTISWQSGDLLLADGKVLSANEQTIDNLAALASQHTGQSLGGGHYCHAGFYVGSRYFYQQLRNLDAPSLNGLNMCSILYTNHLYGNEALKRAQRIDARFINTGMLATLTGAVVSDSLKGYQMVSGVGGQYDFVAQAHELSNGRSIICLHSTRTSVGKTHSNIVWDYAHTTIPRHLRDIVVTEYGVADLRGKSDRDVIISMLCIADSRFQSHLLKQAKAANKIEQSFNIPAAFTHNYPHVIKRLLSNKTIAALLPYYPMGSDFSKAEMPLAIMLKLLKQRKSNLKGLFPLLLRGWKHRKFAKAHWHDELDRMNVRNTRHFKDFIYQLLVIGALSDILPSDRPFTGFSMPPNQANINCSNPDKLEKVTNAL